MKSIIFNQHQVNHALKNEEGMFRLVCKRQPCVDLDKYSQNIKQGAHNAFIFNNGYEFFSFGKPKFQVGETIFAKEAFLQKLGSTQLPSGEYESFFTGSDVEYVADGAEERFVNPNAYYSDYWKKRPAQHMKQEHSRLTLRIKSVKVERLGEISEEDCWKEGCEEFADYQDKIKVCEMAKQIGDCIEDPRPHFAVYWNSTHKKPEEKFEANPFVFVYNYEVLK